MVRVDTIHRARATGAKVACLRGNDNVKLCPPIFKMLNRDFENEPALVEAGWGYPKKRQRPLPRKSRSPGTRRWAAGGTRALRSNCRSGRAAQQTFHAQMLINGRPINTISSAAWRPLAALGRVGSRQARIPRQRHADGASVRKRNAEKIGRDFYVLDSLIGLDCG
jgi:hypothetical protein